MRKEGLSEAERAARCLIAEETINECRRKPRSKQRRKSLCAASQKWLAGKTLPIDQAARRKKFAKGGMSYDHYKASGCSR